MLRMMALTGTLLLASHAVWAGERQMVVDSVPRGAHVDFGGSEIGVTPVVMNLPTAYFEPPMTIWARHLGAPLKLTLSLPGYQSKTVDLGDGPNSWTSLNGANHFDYYLLHSSYTITLDTVAQPQQSQPPGTTANDPVAVANALEKLARLREQGLLTDAEFQAQKKALLGLSVPAPSEAPSSPQVDAEHFCRQLMESAETAHSLDSSGSPLLKGAHGPLVRCLWKSPAPNVQSVTFFVQCELLDITQACQTIGALRAFAGDDPHIACRAQLGSDWAYVFTNKCVAFESGAGDSAAVEPITSRVLAAFIAQHS